jgi:lipopolysaccharide export system protein LptC
MSEARILRGARPWRGASPRRPVRRSRLVAILRVVLPVLALVLVGLVLAWPNIGPVPGVISVPTFVPGDADQPDMLRMDSPRYVGQTRSQRPYEVVARAASLDPLKADVVYLEQPTADVVLGDDDQVRLVAASGIYDRGAQRLMLEGGIEVVTGSGYRFVTPSAQADLAQGRVRGSEQIEGEGPAGTLSADRFDIQDGGEVLRFDGRVRVTLPPSAGREAPSDRPATAQTDEGSSS